MARIGEPILFACVSKERLENTDLEVLIVPLNTILRSILT
jgi:hypothetical protein